MVRSSVAYVPKQRRAEKSDQLRVVYGARSASRRLHFGVSLSLSLLLGMVVFSLFCRAQLTEVTEQINQETKKLEILESEELRLRSKLEDGACAQSVEEKARRLGMEKIHAYQVDYVNVSRDDNVEVN